jgi:cytoskeleton protein RodZ
MDLIDIGATLREARESRGLSVEAVEEKTKIAHGVITALEEGNRERFPHAVYARGFVRSYALLLGLDAAELCQHFAREYPVPSDNDHPEAKSSGIRVRERDPAGAVTALRVAAVVGVLALGALGWYLYDFYLSREAPVAIPAVEEQVPAPQARTLPPEDMPAPLTQMQEVAEAPLMSTEEAQNASAAAEGNGTGTANAVATETVPETLPQAPAEASAQTPAPPAEEAAQEPAVPVERTLVISAHSASWLQARPDDKVVDYFLRKGESVTIDFRESLTVKFGNAGGVDLILDGKAYPFEAKLGEVRTEVFE